jgi:hypothetical protein
MLFHRTIGAFVNTHALITAVHNLILPLLNHLEVARAHCSLETRFLLSIVKNLQWGATAVMVVEEGEDDKCVPHIFGGESAAELPASLLEIVFLLLGKCHVIDASTVGGRCPVKK